MSGPLAIDLYAGLGGWTEGFLAEGYEVIGFDIERHVYGEHRYPAQLVLQDVRTLHGSQFKDAAIIVASSPCQEFSYRAMPWSRAKALGPPLLGMELFAQAARIQREACEAAGRYIPMIQENVRGAQKYVGRAQWHYGSYYLWGDVPALMPIPHKAVKVPGMNWSGYGESGYVAVGFNTRADQDGRKTTHAYAGPGSWKNEHGDDWRATKNTGGSWFNVAHNKASGHGNNARDALVPRSGDGVKHSALGDRENGRGSAWFATGPASHGSKSSARKAASARIAKIPFALAQHIARVYKPVECAS